jgi:hypothetical protein
MSCSAWASPCFVAYRRAFGKRLLEGKKRKVVDFRRLNENCPTDAYPIPALDQLIDEFSEAAYLGAIDLKSGYW